MKATRYFLPVILLTVLSADVFAQDPSAVDAMTAIRSYWKGDYDVYFTEISDIRVGKQLEVMGQKYWPVRLKAKYRKKYDGEGSVLPRANAGAVVEIEWNLVEDGFGGYELKP